MVPPSWVTGYMEVFTCGFASNPAKKYPQYFPVDGVFGRYPYLLASIIASVMCLGPFIVNILLLPETRHRKRRLVLVPEVKPDVIQANSEELVEMLPKGPSHCEEIEGTTQRSSETVMLNPQTIQVKSASESEPDLSEVSQLTSKLVEVVEMDNKTSSEKHVHISVESKDVPKGFAACVGLYSLLSFCVIGADEVFTVWASTDIHLHGLGFGTEELGVALGTSSLPLLFIQVYIFPAAESRFGSKHTFEFSCLFLIFLGTTVGALRIFLTQPTTLWVCLLLYMGLTKICILNCFSAVSILTNNSVPPEYVGSLNGIAMTFAALFRGLAPTVGGSIFAWSITSGVKIGFPFDVNLVFIIFGSVFLASNILCSLTPKRLNQQSTAVHSKTR
ncbi:hypothetical protein LSAT2_006341 [Lamellibrachia satsuma]|nr:hypothetical protein LSAT2_006341 [Lamellibrachia satsuma]